MKPVGSRPEVSSYIRFWDLTSPAGCCIFIGGKLSGSDGAVGGNLRFRLLRSFDL